MAETLQTNHIQDDEPRDFDRTVKVGEAVTDMLYGQVVNIGGAQVILAEE